MNVHLEDFLSGFRETIELYKQGENIFDMGNHSLFPNITTQQKWRYAKNGNFLRLSDGNNVYHFDLPTGESSDEDFAATRGKDLGPHEFEAGATSKGLAQVHRADPGSIYFTIQEGYRNPTYTLRHTGGDNWKGIPKKKAKKKDVILPVDPEAVKKGMEENLDKTANLNQLLGTGMENGINGLQDLLFAPRENPMAAAGIGALGGLGYDLGKRVLYNSPEENANEGIGTTLKRMAIPAAGLGALGGIESNLMNHKPNHIAGM
jgi:hypothetical protein